MNKVALAVGAEPLATGFLASLSPSHPIPFETPFPRLLSFTRKVYLTPPYLTI